MRYIFIFCLLFSLGVRASQLIEREIEVQTQEKNETLARKALIDQASEKVSEQLVKEIIGESKYTRNKPVIESKIIRQSARFIPAVKAGDLLPMPAGEGYKMALQVRVNVDDLQALLLQQGLFYESDATPIVLPVIKFADRSAQEMWLWWANEESKISFLTREGQNLENAFRSAFSKNNFYTLRPQQFHFYAQLPVALRKEELTRDELSAMARLWNAQVLVAGQVDILRSHERSEGFHVAIKLIASEVATGRVIAEVLRQRETDVGPHNVVVARKLKELYETATNDLSAQLLEAWQKGVLNSKLTRLVLKGRLPLKEQKDFKDTLKGKSREIKNVKERLIERDALTYEVDSSLGAQELAQKIPKLELSTTQLVLDSASEGQLIYKIMAKPASAGEGEVKK